AVLRPGAALRTATGALLRRAVLARVLRRLFGGVARGRRLRITGGLLLLGLLRRVLRLLSRLRLVRALTRLGGEVVALLASLGLLLLFLPVDAGVHEAL